MTVSAYAERTIAAYRSHARKAIQNWRRTRKPSRFLRRFGQLLKPGNRVLDYGCGIGSDLAWLRKQGFQVEGLDGVLEFVLKARRCCPGVPITHGRFETVPLPAGVYDGIWCNAALIHVPPEVLQDQLRKLSRALKPSGILGMTLAWGRAKGFTSRDWIRGRYIACYSKDEVPLLFREWSVHSLKVVSRDGRQGRWIQVLASS